jgi:hypothetical protein
VSSGLAALAAALIIGLTAAPLRAQVAAPAPTPLPSLLPPEREPNFAVLGAAVGTPGYVNVVGGYFWKTVAVQAAAGYWSQDRWGLQGAVVWRAIHHPGISVGPAALLGTFGTLIDSASAGSGSTHRRQVYLGPALDVYLDGFHLQAGVAYGFRDYPSNPQLVIQTGYFFRLR